MFVEVNCPACGDGTIRLEPDMLLQGASFACDGCNASVSLADSSQSDLSNGLAEFHKLKRKVSSMRAEEAGLN